MDRYEALRHYFGHTSFREGQDVIIDALLSGRDALAVMPTGAGKSMCFQIPALIQEGVALVISPLISLMKDQVLSLVQMGAGKQDKSANELRNLCMLGKNVQKLGIKHPRGANNLSKIAFGIIFLAKSPSLLHTFIHVCGIKICAARNMEFDDVIPRAQNCLPFFF